MYSLVEPPCGGSPGQLDIDEAEGYLNVVWGGTSTVARYLGGQGFVGLERAVRGLGRRIAYLTGMEVYGPSQGRGHGTAMLRAALTELRRRGVIAVYLHALPETGRGTDLLRFYERNGFVSLDCCEEDYYPVMVAQL